ncbi:hypothetical protein GCM10023114_31980 [Mycolicibacterium sediminis]|uniref:Uncharacterized protein n=1 Tax=Mycolicibacterium sediminis TaxID=1286180 RepID=A0A7I7QKE6_9MYCO|nr:hypothetical protein MSEDJ_08270 [Mycolicibacterium sediminis]
MPDVARTVTASAGGTCRAPDRGVTSTAAGMGGGSTAAAFPTLAVVWTAPADDPPWDMVTSAVITATAVSTSNRCRRRAVNGVLPTVWQSCTAILENRRTLRMLSAQRKW